MRHDIQVNNLHLCHPWRATHISSSRHPDGLYKNGIQRSSFIPAIELLKSQFDVTDLDSGTGELAPSVLKVAFHIDIIFYPDYRRIPRALSRVYYDPLSPENTNEINKVFTSLTSADPSDAPIRNRVLHTWGRTILVPESTTKVAKFTFHELCGQPLSAADYLEVTKNFETVFLLDVPKMDLSYKDLVIILLNLLIPTAHVAPQARRFITFIDGSCVRHIRE